MSVCGSPRRSAPRHGPGEPPLPDQGDRSLPRMPACMPLVSHILTSKWGYPSEKDLMEADLFTDNSPGFALASPAQTKPSSNAGTT